MNIIRKKLYGAMLCLILSLGSLSTAIYGEENPIRIFVNGSEVMFQQGSAKIHNGVTLVPMQEILLHMGAEVYLIKNDDIDMIVAENGNFAFAMNVEEKGLYKAYVDDNGKVTTESTLSEEMVTRQDNVLMYPIRPVADLLGASITWDQRTNTVNIWTKEKLKELSEAVQKKQEKLEKPVEATNVEEEDLSKEPSEEILTTPKETMPDPETEAIQQEAGTPEPQQPAENETTVEIETPDQTTQPEAFKQNTEEGTLEI